MCVTIYVESCKRLLAQLPTCIGSEVGLGQITVTSLDISKENGHPLSEASGQSD